MPRLPKDCQEDFQAFLGRQEELVWDIWTKWLHDVLGSFLPREQRPSNRCLWTDLWNDEVREDRQAKAHERKYKPTVIMLKSKSRKR